MMKSQISATWVALFALTVSGASLGEEIKVKRTYCYSGTVTMMSDDKNMAVYAWEQMGPSRDMSGQQHPDQSLHCMGTGLVMGGETKVHGYCKVLYPDGNYTIVEVASAREGETFGNWKVLYGTGKYADATGQGTYRIVTSAKPLKEGTYQRCSETDGAMNLKSSE